MDKIELAIAYLQEQACKAKSMDAVRSLHLAEMALKKTQPMLVQHEKTFWTYKHYCPVCSELIDKENLRFCDKCGQRLDWSNYWEAIKK